MTDQRSRIVKRVVRSLEDGQDPDTLVWSYFEADRQALIEATRQTLAATREDTPDAKIEEAVERELVDALRYPERRRGGVVANLWVHRVWLWAAGIGAVGASLLAVFL